MSQNSLFKKTFYILCIFLFCIEVNASAQFSCKNFRALGYSVTWSGAQKGKASGDRGGRYWEFNGESIIFNLQTPFRQDIGQLWFAHPKTDIEYFPGNEYRLELGLKKHADHGKLQLNQPWFEGLTKADSGYLEFSTHTLPPVDTPCIEGHGQAKFYDKNSEQIISVELNFAIDVSGRKFRS